MFQECIEHEWHANTRNNFPHFVFKRNNTLYQISVSFDVRIGPVTKKCFTLFFACYNLTILVLFSSRRYIVKFTVLYKLNTLHLEQFTLGNSPGKYKKNKYRIKGTTVCRSNRNRKNRSANNTFDLTREFYLSLAVTVELKFFNMWFLQCLRTVDLYIL